VPGYAVAGALIYVGILMSSGLAKIDWLLIVIDQEFGYVKHNA